MSSDGVHIIFYINLFLLCGVSLRHFFKRLAAIVPYTVLLMLIGGVLGVVAIVISPDRNTATECEQLAALGNASGSLALVSGSGSGSVAMTSGSGSSGSGSVEWAVTIADAHFLTVMKVVANLDPHMLLYIFLPALLFESAQAIDYHVFKKVIYKTITLAFPGMATGSILMACLVKLAYGDWTWDLCLLLGVITSATDPVAVVALLRELGAKVSLSTTIEGESLLNDGSAVVIFSVLMEVAKGTIGVNDAGTVVGTFVRMAIGGPIIGWVFGHVALYWISHVFNDAMVEISISITTAYISFYVSEFWCKSSGVLTVVFVGLAFSGRGRQQISPEVFHFLHEFWETLGYVANTLIFLITGIAIVYNWPSALPPSDILISIGLYAGGLVIRMFLFGLTYYPFTKTPYGWSWKEMLIASWGGLRGAVGLALGLLVMFGDHGPCNCDADASPSIGCDMVKSRILLHTSMMVVCTLCINASLLKPLLAALRFVELSDEELTMLSHVADRIIKQAKSEMGKLKTDPFLSNSNWEVVRQYADLNELFRPLLKDKTHTHKEKHRRDSVHGDGAARASGLSEGGSPVPYGGGTELHDSIRSGSDENRRSYMETLSRHSMGGRTSYVSELLNHESSMEEAGGTEAKEETLLAELKYHYHMSLKAGVWHLQHQGTLGMLATDILVDACNHKLDDKQKVDWLRWTELEQGSSVPLKGFRPKPWLQQMRALPLLRDIANWYLSNRLQMLHDVAYGYLQVHEHLEHEVEHWSTNEKHVAQLHEVMHDNAEGARRALIHLQEVLPEVCLAVNTRQAARLMLNATREKISHLEEHGALPEPQAKVMIAQVETQMRKLKLASMELTVSKERVLREVPWMTELSEASFRILLDAAVERTYETGQYLVRQGDLAIADNENVFLVARGIVEIIEEYENNVENVVARRGSGVVIGEQSLLTSSPRAASARACTSVMALGLPHSAMRSAMENYPDLERRMWHTVGKNLVQKLLGDDEEATLGERTSSTEELTAEANEWVPSVKAISCLEPDHTMVLERRMMLLHGACIEYREAELAPTSLADLKVAIGREKEEALKIEQMAIKMQKMAKPSFQRRRSFQARFFGAADGSAAHLNGLSGTLDLGHMSEGGGGNAEASRGRKASMNPAEMARKASMSAAAIGGAIGGKIKTEVTRRGSGARGAAATTSAASGLIAGSSSLNNAVDALSSSPPVQDGTGVGRERRQLHTSSPFIIHLAPCIIEAPTGGMEAKHLLKCVTACKLCMEPKHGSAADGESPSRAPSPMAVRSMAGATGGHLDGAPLPLLTTPHTLRRDLREALLKKLVAHRYAPGEALFGQPGPDDLDDKVAFILSGTVSCDAVPYSATGAGGAPSAADSRMSAYAGPAADDDEADNVLHSAGEPFVHGSSSSSKDSSSKDSSAESSSTALTLAPPAGASFGEWALLTPTLKHVPRVVAASAVSVVYLDERDLTAAMQADDNLAKNLWWARAQRETYTLLRKREPFCHWNTSKLWRWLAMGKHINVPEGRGQLGVQAPFVVLLHGRCHVQMQPGFQPPARPLLGSGAQLTDVLAGSAGTFLNDPIQPGGSKPSSPTNTTGIWSDRLNMGGGAKSPPLPGGDAAGASGRWVGGPEIIYCHDEVGYHFARDSLLFVPGEKALPWLPSNYVFGEGKANGMPSVPSLAVTAKIDEDASLANPLAA